MNPTLYDLVPVGIPKPLLLKRRRWSFQTAIGWNGYASTGHTSGTSATKEHSHTHLDSSTTQDKIATATSTDEFLPTLGVVPNQFDFSVPLGIWVFYDIPASTATGASILRFGGINETSYSAEMDRSGIEIARIEGSSRDIKGRVHDGTTLHDAIDLGETAPDNKYAVVLIYSSGNGYGEWWHKKATEEWKMLGSSDNFPSTVSGDGSGFQWAEARNGATGARQRLIASRYFYAIGMDI